MNERIQDSLIKIYRTARAIENMHANMHDYSCQVKVTCAMIAASEISSEIKKLEDILTLESEEQLSKTTFQSNFSEGERQLFKSFFKQLSEEQLSETLTKEKFLKPLSEEQLLKQLLETTFEQEE